jgi:hypothetical protein
MPTMETLKQIQDEAHGIPGAPSGQKKKKAENKVEKPLIEVKKSDVDRQVRNFEITTSGKVKIGFVELISQAPDEVEDDSTVMDNGYSIVSKHLPHKDLLDAMKVMRKHAMHIIEMEIPANLNQYTVCGFSISGDLVMKQSRITLKMAKEVKRTGKTIAIPGAQVTMYGESEYEKIGELTPLIEKAIKEVEAYLAGKYADDFVQLPLFAR